MKQKSVTKQILVWLLTIMFCLGVVGLAPAETASTIRLIKTEGTVNVTDSSKKTVTTRADMRLFSGYHVVTQGKSYAWASLDKEKAAKLDEFSEMEVRESGKQLELLLDSGSFFFNVTAPLKGEETMNIRTSTMVMGIRGTCGWVRVIDGRHTVVYLLEGTVTCSVTNPVAGQTKYTKLHAGECADFYVYDPKQPGDKCEIIKHTFDEDDIPGFVLIELLGDEPLCEAIYEAAGIDLRGLTPDGVMKKMLQEQTAVERLFDEILRKYQEQERNISIEPVWEDRSDEGSTGGGGGGGTSDTIVLTMKVTAQEIQDAMDTEGITHVIVQPSPEPLSGDYNTLHIDIDMNVAAGDTLDIREGVPVIVDNDGGITVNGTANLSDTVENRGTVTVKSGNTLTVSSQFINTPTGKLDNTVTGRSVVKSGIVSDGIIENAGRLEGNVEITGGRLTITGGEIIAASNTATVTISGGVAELTAGIITANNSSGGSALAWNVSDVPTGGTMIRSLIDKPWAQMSGEYQADRKSDNYYYLGLGYLVKIDEGDGGDATADVERSRSGNIITVTVTPETGYEVESVVVTTEDGDAVPVTDNGDGTYNFVMPKKEVVIKPAFIKTVNNYTVSVTAGAGGTAVSSVTSAKAGDPVTVTVTPDAGYVTGSVTAVDSTSADVSVTDNGDNTYSLTMPASAVTVTVSFTAIPTYTISVTAGAGGSAVSSVASAKAGEAVMVTATPDAGYVTGSVTAVDSTSADVSVTDNGDNTYSLTMPASAVTVTVSFTATPTYTVSVTAGAGGTAVSSVASAKAGEAVTVTVTPDAGYVTGSVTAVDSTSADVSVTDNGDNTYSLTMPASAVTVTVNFTITTLHAILYNDGYLVFQKGDTADGAHGTVTGGPWEVNLNGYADAASVPWYGNRASITTVDFAALVQPRSTAYWFYDCANLGAVENIANLDTSQVTDMSFMFYACGLTTLDVSGFDTGAVTDMNSMFYDCGGLSTLDVSGFNTGNVTNMSGMFHGCSSLTALDVSGFNTSQVTKMSYMFENCSGVTTLDVSGFDTGNSTSMTGMFWNCSGVSVLDVSGFDTAKVTNMSGMFYNCVGLTTLDVSGFDTGNVGNMFSMFQNCTALTGVDVSGINTGNVTSMQEMFTNCPALTTLDVSGFDTSKVTNMDHMFAYCTNLTTITASTDFVTTAVTTSVNMFANCTALTGGKGTPYSGSYIDKTYARIDTALTPGYFTGPASLFTYAILYSDGYLVFQNGDTADAAHGTVTGGPWEVDLTGYSYVYSIPWQSNRTSIKKVDFKDVVQPQSTSMWFSNCFNMTGIDHIENLDTSQATSLNAMFQYCEGLTDLDVTGFDTSQVTRMDYLFHSCKSLTDLDVSGFDTSQVTTMLYMFAECPGLTTLDVSSFNTSQVTNMNYMFYGCSGLTSLNVSSLDTGSVTGMEWMFRDCSNLTTLDVSSFNTSQVTDMISMFYGCANLITITASENFVTDAATDSTTMFTGCTALTGGNGTPYNGSYTDKTYARIDTALTPGYFTGTAVLSAIYAIVYDDGYLVFQKGNTPDGAHGIVVGTYEVSMLEYDAADSIPWYASRADITTVDFKDTVQPKSTAYWFSGLENLTGISNLDKLDTSQTTDMHEMFKNCKTLVTLNLNDFDTSQVMNMHEMFAGCREVMNLSIENFDTSNVNDMGEMFYECCSLDSLDLSHFNTGNVTDMNHMFSECYALTTLNLSGFDTGNVTDMSFMFCECLNLPTLDLSGFNTANVTDMTQMFYSCSNLTKINTSASFVTDAVTNSAMMFSGCSVLTGGNGTPYSDTYTDKTYARIDTTTTPGYFSN